MAKCFVSFLGTSDYLECNYLLAEQRVDRVCFVQTALLQLTAKDFGADDRVLIGCTDKARAKNFDKLLAEVKDARWSGPPVEAIALPEATSEEELWDIFEAFNREIQDNDELVVDITHSFRSLPLLFTVLTQYLGVVKKARLRGVYYGAFEVLGPREVVKKMPLEERDAPIIDLTAFLELYQWGAGLDHFRRFGQVGVLGDLVADRIRPILRQTKGRDANASAMREVVNHLEGFATATQYVRGKELTKLRFRGGIVAPLHQVAVDFIPPLQPLLARLAERFSDWNDKDEGNALRAVQWCIDHEQVQQGLTLLQETLIGHYAARCADLLEPVGADHRDLEYRRVARRDLISALLAVLGKGLPESEWKKELAEHPGIARACARRIPPDVCQVYESITQLRNDMNHGGYGQSARSANKLREGLDQEYQAVCALLAQSEPGQADHACPRAGAESTAGKTYFVSRHPGATAWAAEEGIQVDARVSHLDPATLQRGDTVIGTLPVNLAAEVCQRGARYRHLSLDLPEALRGKELDAAAMRACGARLEDYRIDRNSDG